ncbi:RHS repeat domain-containing protein [Clostridium grantii]|nr:RHS repeat-associated core domain-containing protein [Clostridium grantii]
MNGNGYTISYKYNNEGIRTEKTVNGVTTKYYLEGDKVTFETNGTDSIHYTYDSNGRLVSMDLNGTEYYYIRNAQGDIIGLFDKNGTTVVQYTYDSWGKLISTTGSLASTVGAKNPYRYRGYRYDSETGLYYLQSRYYNPEFCRMLNADALAGNVGDLLSHNIFMYSKNNPVNMSDPSGFREMISATVAEETQEMREVSCELMNPAIARNKEQKALKKNVKVNTAVGTGNVIAGLVKELKYHKIETLPSVKYYLNNKMPIKEVFRKWGSRAGYIGIGYGIYDVGEDLVQGKIVGALIDAASFGASAAAGYYIGGIGASVVIATGAVGIAAIGISGLAVVGGIVVGVGISYVAEETKKWWYRRKNT